MRLDPKQITAIRQAVLAIAGPHARIIVFGSRLRDDAKGGDLDLLVESEQVIDLYQQARIKIQIEEHLNLPVDIITRQLGAGITPFQRIALETGVSL